MELENHPFNVRDCLDSSLEMLAVRADEKGLELLCDVDPAIPALMTGDRSRLRQIILNLAGNAIKFTSAGEISLVAEIEQRHDRGSMLRFTISDTGIGIPASQLAHIFEPFTQSRLIDDPKIWRYWPGAYHLHPPGSSNGGNNQCGQRGRPGK